MKLRRYAFRGSTTYAKRGRARAGTGILLALSALLVVPLLSNVCRAADSSPVVATVGSHQITQQEVDAKLQSQLAAWQSRLYQLRKQAIESIADDYLLQQAAKKANLSVDEYLKRADAKAAPHVTEADARQYYEQHKEQIRQPFEKIKEPLIAALERQEVQGRREALLNKLRAEQKVKILIEPPRVEVASAGHPAWGKDNAPVTIVEFGDFQCPFCLRAESILKQIRTKYGDKIRLVYMDFPLGMHAHAFDAAEAGRCAGEQNKFWQYHDAVFADQAKLSATDLKATAARVGLNSAQFNSCFDHSKYQSEIHKDLNEGMKLGVTGTPTFFINGRELVGAQPEQQFDEVISDEAEHAAAHQPVGAADAGESIAGH
jgi:protein-disulfide isomerase